jgi:nicotinamidase-related amidase
MSHFLARSEASAILIIDIQDRLLSAMPEGVQARITEQVNVLLQAANLLTMPVLVTEQYPKGLGHTDAAITATLPPNTPVVEKTLFSAYQVEAVRDWLHQHSRQQVILLGMETHICILQTALDLVEAGFEVFVIEDGVSSRAKGNQFNALQRLRLAGVTISNTESILFEWLGDAKHPHFKTLSKLIV